MRNVSVEQDVDRIIERFDKLARGEALGRPPASTLKAVFDNHVSGHGGSVRLACAFLTAYCTIDKSWDFKAVPTGTRGVYGDKKLANALTLRHVTFHKNITAFGENLGWKGNVREFDLSKDGRFWPYLEKLAGLGEADRESLLNHVVWMLFSSRVVPQAFPPLPNTYLSYAKSLALCERLTELPSEGHIQQFLVAAFLAVHRRRYGHRIATHHPHASDTFDGTCGDIEEFRDEELVAAYEVTVRDDWKNRLADFGKKAASGRIAKYVIFAADVRSDAALCPAERLVEFVGHLPYDLAVVDLADFFAVFCAELSREDIALAFNTTYQYLCDPRLCGRDEFQKAFLAVTDAWLESRS